MATKGRWNEAVNEYARAFELDPAQFGGLAIAGNLLMDHGLTTKAVELWTRYLAVAPPDHPRRAESEEQLRHATAPSAGLISKF